MRPFCIVKSIISPLVMVMTFLQPYAALSEDIYTFRDEGNASYFTNIPGPDRVKVRLPLVQHKTRINSLKHSTAYAHKEYESAITKAGTIFAVDPDLVKAVIRAESNFNVRAISPKGALGLMQLMPDTARKMNITDPLDPVANIHGGVRYLSELLDLLKGNLPLALAAYNAGPARVVGQDRLPHIAETRNYVGKVLNYYRNLKDGIENRI